MKIICISDYEELKKIVDEFNKDSSNGVLFRGEPDILVPSIVKKCSFNSYTDLIVKEKYLLKEFNEYCHKDYTFKKGNELDWEIRIAAREYGLASSLMDWTLNLNIALEFAIYNFLSNDVMRDMDLIDVLLKFDPANIKYVPKDLREDHSFIKNVIEKYKVNELEPIFNNNKELITKIIEKNGKYLKKFSQYINDIDMVKLALKTYNHIDILTPNMLENKELVLDILKKDPSECKHLFSLKKYVNDLDVMKLAIKHDHKLFYHSNSITDIEILNYVVEKTEDFALVIKEQIQNKELMIKLINNKENINLMMCNQNFIYKYKNDIEIVQKIISIDPTQIEKFPKFKKDKDIIFYALQCGLSQINKIDVSLYHDIDIVNSFIKKIIVG